MLECVSFISTREFQSVAEHGWRERMRILLIGGFSGSRAYLCEGHPDDYDSDVLLEILSLCALSCRVFRHQSPKIYGF